MCIRDSNSANAELQNGANQNASSNITVNSYLMFLVDNLNKRTSTSAGEVVFDGEIVGIFFDQAKTRAENVDGNTYHSSSLIYAMSGSGGVSNSADSDGGRMPEGKKPSSGMTNFFNSTQSHGSGVLRIVAMVLIGFLFQIMEVEQIIFYNLERKMRILPLEII